MPDDLTLRELAERLGSWHVVDDGPGEMLSQVQLADRLGISDRAVRDLHELGLPVVRSRRGPRYPWLFCRTWFSGYRIRSAQPLYRRSHLSLEDARREWQLSEWLSAPGAYRLIPTELWEALLSARIRVDARTLRELQRARGEA